MLDYGTTGESVDRIGYCPYCSNPPWSYISHCGKCPRVKAEEYYPDGTLRRIEFHGNNAMPRKLLYDIFGSRTVEEIDGEFAAWESLSDEAYWAFEGSLDSGYNESDNTITLASGSLSCD